MFWSIFEQLCADKGISANAACLQMELSNATATHWKQGSWPRQSTLEKIADFFGYTAEDIIAMKGTQILNGSEDIKSKASQNGSLPKLNEYKWWFSEDTEADKLYNKVCYTLYILHGRMKASAMLSAIDLPSDKTSGIDNDALKWLAYKSGTEITLFTTDDFETGKSNLETIRSYVKECDRRSQSVPHTAEDWKATREEYPAMKKWDENYAYLFNLAVEEATSSEYITEIFEEFSRYPNEHADLMAYIRQGIANFETDRQRRLDRRNAAMNAQKEETA